MWISDRERPMAGNTDQELDNVFQYAVKQFNSNHNNYIQLLHNNVVINHINDPTGASSIFGTNGAQASLNNYPANFPQFTDVSHIVDHRSGIVKGVATWDDGGGPIKIDYLFIFVFVPNPPNPGKWFILNLHAWASRRVR
jgi:hypothetical protein